MTVITPNGTFTDEEWLTMTYDSRDEFKGSDDNPTELDVLLDVAYEALIMAKQAGETTMARINRLEADLEECLEYLKEHYDVKDGPDGTQSPNRAMQLGQMIEQTLHGRPF